MSAIAATSEQTQNVSTDDRIFVTMRIDGQLIGMSVHYVCDVLHAQKVIPVPLAPKEISGLFNLRGRIVTVIDVRERLRVSARAKNEKNMFVVVEYQNELYCFVVDSVGEVITTESSMIEALPANLSDAWKGVSSGICKLPDELLVIVDVPRLLALS